MAEKKDSYLRRMGKSGISKPVDSVTKRVLGLYDAKRRGRIAKELSEARERLASLTDAQARARLETRIRDLEFRSKYGGASAIGPGAERRARRALEGAAWERSTRRGK